MAIMTKHDLVSVLRMIPIEVRDLMKAGELAVGGGFIRDTIIGEEPSDIDLFGADSRGLTLCAANLAATATWNGRVITTPNACTVVALGRRTVQFITRWTYPTPSENMAMFDFTMAQATVYWSKREQAWVGLVGDRFYQDCAARRLCYTSPMRQEEPGGSMLRAFKFARRGWRIAPEDLSKVMARMAMAIKTVRLPPDPANREEHIAEVFSGLLRDVDPMTPIDGRTIAEENEPEF